MSMNRLLIIFYHIFIQFFLSVFHINLIFCLDPNKKLSQYNHTIWKTKDGLPQNSIRAITQTPDGYIWLGSQEGVTRFDGVRFLTFNKYNNEYLKTNWIGSLYVSKDSSLWIGNYGYGISQFYANQWKYYSKKDGLMSDIVPSFVYDHKNNLWIVTNRGIVLSWLESGKRVFDYLERFPKLVTNILIDKNNSKWIVTNNGLYLSKDEREAVPVILKQMFTISENNAYLIDDSDKFWVATDNSIICYYLQSRSLISETRWPVNKVSDRKIMILDKNKNLWIGTTGNGLFRYQNGALSAFTQKDGLSNDFILALFEDFEGNIWVGTDEGLNKFSDGLFTTFSQTEGLVNNSVTALCEDSSGAVWIGTRSGMNILLEDQLHLPNNYEENIKKKYIWTLLCDSFGNVWAADVSDNVYHFVNHQVNTYKLSYQFKDNDITRLKEIEVNTLYKSKNNRIWLGTRNGLFEIINDHFIEYSMLKDCMPVGSLINIVENAENDFFISTSSGGFLRFVNNRYSYTPIFYDSVKVIFSTSYKDDEGYNWIGSFESGLYRFDGKHWTHYTQKDGLFSNSIFTILEDDNGYLWMSSNYGITKVSKKELNEYAEGKTQKISTIHYDETDGMKTSECNGGAGPNGLKTRDGRLFFSTNKGVAIIDPNAKFMNKRSPNVVIEKVIGDQKDLSVSETVILEAGTKNIEILYTALSFIAPQKVFFKYRLKGLDDEWISVGTRRVAYYNNLSPGNYTFQVIACNNSGVWNETGAEIHLYIQPFFYQTLWFYGIIIILILTAITVAFWWRIQIINNRQFMLETVITERTKEIKIKNEQLEQQSEQLKELDHFKSRFFTNISHEFRTPLTLILGPLNDLLENENNQKNISSLLMIRNNASRVLKLINQLLDIAKLDSEKFVLRVAKRDIVRATRIIISSFESVVKQKEIILDLFSSDPIIITYLDYDVYEKIIINLISNAYKFTPRKGTISVTIIDSKETDSDFLEIQIKDNGEGVHADLLTKIFDRFFQIETSSGSGYRGTGIGLALTKELVLLHHGTISVKSEQGRGTEFTIRFPKLEKYYISDSILEKTENDIIKTETVDEITSTLIETSHVSSCAEVTEINMDKRTVILIVEDNDDVRQYLCDCLQNDYWVITAENGLSGFQKATIEIPDLIVSDVMMPEMNGYELTKNIKTDNRTSHIPVILLTAKGDEDSRLEGLETGADDYLIKPFNKKELIVRINNLISIRHKLQEKYQNYILLEPAAVGVESMDEQFLRKAIDIVENYIEDSDFDVLQFSKEIGLSRPQLYRKLKALINQTPTEFIRTMRLKRAVQYLNKKSGNITEIAYKCGFNNLSYFAKCFKEEFGVLPSDYEKNKKS